MRPSDADIVLITHYLFGCFQVQKKTTLPASNTQNKSGCQATEKPVREKITISDEPYVAQDRSCPFVQDVCPSVGLLYDGEIANFIGCLCCCACTALTFSL